MAGSKQFTIFTKFAVRNNFSGPVLAMAKGADKFAARVDGMKRAAAGIGKFAKSAAIGVGLVGGAAVLAGKQFSDAASQVEKYKATLKVMLGSQEAANERFEEMSKFAAVTPFELGDAVELGNKLQALGKYSVENMRTLGDLAAAAGKPIDQVSSAFAKLASGQKGVAVDMFRDLLISTKDWQEATGKGITASGSLMATTEEMLTALPKILKAKGFAGMMEEQSKTFEGMSSNLSDSITRFKAAVGEGLNTSLKKIMPKIQGQFEKITAWVGRNSDKFVKFFDTVFGYIERAGQMIAPIFEALKPLVKPILDLIEPIFKIFENLMPTITVLVSAVSKILEPVLWVIKTILDGIAFITGAQPAVAAATPSGPANLGTYGAMGGYLPGATPMSPASSTISSSSTTRSMVDISVGNLPPGSTVVQDKPAPGVTLSTGRTVPLGPSDTGRRF